MSSNGSHETLVESQFGARADAYLKSTVHAQGPDLAELAALARGCAGGRGLDLGCGGGHVTFAAAPHLGSIVAYDLSAEMLGVVAKAAGERGLANVETLAGAVESLPFADAAFDIVLSRYSAHHWHDFAGGVREAARVLKPGGMAGFVDTVAPGSPLLDTYFQAIELLRDPSHVRDYGRPEWESALARAGLVCETAKRFRVRLDFTAWVERMATPPVQIAAIRALQAAVSAEVTGYFETAADGSFSIDVGLFVARKLPD